MIGVVTTSYPRSAGDGAGGFVRQRVLALRAQGEVVEVVAAGDGTAERDEAVTRIPAGALFYGGGAPEALEGGDPWARLAVWGRAVAFSGALLGHLAARGGRWRTVESHWLLPCGLAVRAVLPELPHRAHVHGGDLHLLERLPFADAVARGLCRGRPELVFASATLRDRFAALAGGPAEDFGARSVVEPAPFDRSIFRLRTAAERRSARLELGVERPTLLAAGRLVPIKGHDVLLAAVARMPPAARPAVIVAGEGPERGRLRRRAAAAGVELRLPGDLGQEALSKYMAAADLFVHPSRTLPGGRGEGMPLVVREALARGLPVVASATGGLVELAETPGVVLVPGDDAEALAEALARSLGAGD